MAKPNTSSAIRDLGLPLDHIGIAVQDIEQASQAYDLLGLVRAGQDETVTAQQVTIRAFATGETLIELLAPASEHSPITQFLAKRGPGIHHIAFRVADLEETVAKLRRQGVPFLSQTPSPGRADSQVIFIHPRWAGGVLLELVEHA